METRILMVCLGNICRSPSARHSCVKLPSNNFRVDSAGTGNYHIGKNPDERSIAIAKANGIDISKQNARQFTAQDYADFDYIFAMDGERNYKDILALAPNIESKSKVKLILNEALRK